MAAATHPASTAFIRYDGDYKWDACKEKQDRIPIISE
jgi:hypothetical protein